MLESAFTYADPADPLLKRLAIGALEKATGRDTLKRLYDQHQASGWDGAGFFVTAIRALSLDLRYDAERLAALPRQGPLVVVANHPFGVIDGIVMCALMEKVRPDFRVLTNSVLMRAPEMRERLMPVDFSETPEARRVNLDTSAKALAHAQAGGCVVIFPAGAVSTSPDRWGAQPAMDGPWSPFAARVVARAQADVAPIYFPGQNSRLFQIVSHVHPTLRLALFFHEVRRRIGTPFPVEIGAPVPYARLAHLERAALTLALRSSVYGLGPQPRPR
ncbi:MAG: hypothetical protein JWN93_3953 [Hyphomicrobiales bacterium]|nr:hypothetical protein [Hyphomicrobiales bacterium]